jgi:hypothetical protein
MLDGWDAQVFRLDEDATSYHFVWQTTTWSPGSPGDVTAVVVVVTDELETALAIVTSIAPITEETWQQWLADPSAVGSVWGERTHVDRRPGWRRPQVPCALWRWRRTIVRT